MVLFYYGKNEILLLLAGFENSVWYASGEESLHECQQAKLSAPQDY